MGCGFSRDDAGKFLGNYVKLGIYENDPFQVLDQPGIGKFCHKVGLDYVSCSPYRVPIARLAAAQAAIKESQAKKCGRKKRKK